MRDTRTRGQPAYYSPGSVTSLKIALACADPTAVNIFRHPPRPLSRLLIASLLVPALAGCGVENDTGVESVEVAGVLDGSTLEVIQEGERATVHLLGLQAPGTGECLGAESAEALAALVPVGTEVRLVRAAEDEAAAVYLDDVLVNAELARLGLTFVSSEPSDDILDAIANAQVEAVEDGMGMFGTDDDCTLPAQVAAFEEAGVATVDAAGGLVLGIGVDEVDRHGAALAALATSGVALAALLDGAESARYPQDVVAALRDRTTSINDRLSGATTGVQELRAAEEQRIEAERVEAEAAAAAAAQAAAEEAARAAQEAAEAEAARVAAAAEKESLPSTSGAASVYYANCDAVRAAGAAPILAGQPGYSQKLDRDGDGVGCEN